MVLRGWQEKRQQRREFERSVKARQGKIALRRHIANQKRLAERLLDQAKKAKALGSDRQFDLIGRRYLMTLQAIQKWERSLLNFEFVETQRDQARCFVEFARSVSAMSESILEKDPAAMARMQQELAEALAQAEALEGEMDGMLEGIEETILSVEEVGGESMSAAVKSLEKQLSEEGLGPVPEPSGEPAAPSGSTEMDRRIEEGLKRIEEEMRKGK